MSALLKLARADLLDLEPYSHAAWEPSLERLHANESPWRMPGDNSALGLNRYPEPQPRALVDALASLYEVPPENVLVGRGSDEAIDLLVRGFCRAERDAVMVFPPTFGMYAVAARIQGARVIERPLDAATGFEPDFAAALDACTHAVKLVFVCSPNNPTGTLIDSRAIAGFARALAGRALVVVDEAYLEFAGTPGMLPKRADLRNLVVLRTLSKAFALAGARCGTLIADADIVGFLRRMIPPYALSAPAIEAALQALTPPARAHARLRVERILAERARLEAELAPLAAVRRVYPSAANFLLVSFADAAAALRTIADAGLLVRDMRRQRGLEDCLRITVGTPEQNERLLNAVRRL